MASKYTGHIKDTEMSKVFRKEAWRKCPHCKAPINVQYIQYWSDTWDDGQVWCGRCSSYLGMWDQKEHMVIH